MKSQFAGIHLDFIGFSAALLCAIHCAALPLILSLMPLAGLQFLENEWIERAAIGLSFAIATFSLSKAYRLNHRRSTPFIIVSGGFILIALRHIFGLAEYEALLSVAGGSAIAYAHFINWKYIRQASLASKNYPIDKNFKK